MGTQITEPLLGTPLIRVDTLSIDNKTTVLNKGLAEISISNWNNVSQPTITAGSIYEIAGSYYAESTNAAVSAWSATGTRYLYATASGSSTSWSSSASAPTWSAALHGYYNGASARAFYIVISGVKYKLHSQNNASFPNDVRIGNDLSIGNDASAINVNATDRVIWGEGRTYDSGKAYISSTATQATIFSFLSPFIPNINDEVFVYGSLIEEQTPTTSYKSISPVYAKKTTSTQIDIAGTSLLINLGVTTMASAAGGVAAVISTGGGSWDVGIYI